MFSFFITFDMKYQFFEKYELWGEKINPKSLLVFVTADRLIHSIIFKYIQLLLFIIHNLLSIRLSNIGMCPYIHFRNKYKYLFQNFFDRIDNYNKNNNINISLYYITVVVQKSTDCRRTSKKIQKKTKTRTRRWTSHHLIIICCTTEKCTNCIRTHM